MKLNFYDWLILGVTILGISAYGIWKNRRNKDIQAYLLANRSLPWYTVAFSIIATQASAITFLSAPGQGYFDGVKFVQIYLGLPLAMYVVAKVFLPAFYRSGVITAYEMVEKAFDKRVRLVTAILFLIQRGLAAGLVISAPSIILHEVLGWNFYLTVLAMGGVVVAYTTIGGSAAISQTQFLQMMIILGGIGLAAFWIIRELPPEVDLRGAFRLASVSGKMKTFDLSLNLHDKYTIWSGLIGGFFLQLSYFGTDQSQVERYLSGKSVEESKKGLFFNAIFKLPMQYFILSIGALLFVWYQFEQPPVFFKTATVHSMQQQDTQKYQQLKLIETQFHAAHLENKQNVTAYLNAPNEAHTQALLQSQKILSEYREDAKQVIHSFDTKAKDENYLFLYYVLNTLPHGVIGLLIAIIFLASMSTTASEINALASVTVVDIYKRFIHTKASDLHYVRISKAATVAWALASAGFALSIQSASTLIESINQIGSLFYGVILGIFLLVFYAPRLKPTAVLSAIVIAQIGVLVLSYTDKVSYLWNTVFGCLSLIILAILIHKVLSVRETKMN